MLARIRPPTGALAANLLASAAGHDGLGKVRNLVEEFRCHRYCYCELVVLAVRSDLWLAAAAAVAHLDRQSKHVVLRYRLSSSVDIQMEAMMEEEVRQGLQKSAAKFGVRVQGFAGAQNLFDETQRTQESSVGIEGSCFAKFLKNST
jgi:hypothetical protein